jgi:hypothetical protein
MHGTNGVAKYRNDLYLANEEQDCSRLYSISFTIGTMPCYASSPQTAQDDSS